MYSDFDSDGLVLHGPPLWLVLDSAQVEHTQTTQNNAGEYTNNIEWH